MFKIYVSYYDKEKDKVIKDTLSCEDFHEIEDCILMAGCLLEDMLSILIVPERGE